MRIAALLQSYLYKDYFPNTIADDKDNEFSILASFLAIHSTDDNLFSLNWCCKQPLLLIKTWCHEYTNLVEKSWLGERTVRVSYN